MEKVIKDKLDLIVSGKHKTIADLYVQPVSFPQGAEQFVDDIKFRGVETLDSHEKWGVSQGKNKNNIICIAI